MGRKKNHHGGGKITFSLAQFQDQVHAETELLISEGLIESFGVLKNWKPHQPKQQP